MAEVSFAKRSPEVTFTNIFTAIDLLPTVTYNISAYMLWREREIKRNKLKDTRASKMRYCVNVLGMDQAQAERLFPV